MLSVMARLFHIGTLFAVFAFLLLSLSAFIGDPLRIESRLLANVAGVGMSIGVAPNPENTMAEALHRWDDELAARQAAIVARERMLGAERARTERQAIYVLMAESLLCVLIAFDFIVGRRRAGAVPVHESFSAKFFS